uniref:Ubiquitinyl hydrolase 1 n=1 Tax=Steinernema glaseri TaxID=37863 RepID=A0A1I7Y5J3_9BILA
MVHDAKKRNAATILLQPWCSHLREGTHPWNTRTKKAHIMLREQLDTACPLDKDHLDALPNYMGYTTCSICREHIPEVGLQKNDDRGSPAPVSPMPIQPGFLSNKKKRLKDQEA